MIFVQRLNDSLQFQLEAYKNEVDVIKAEFKSELEKFKAQFIARQALAGNMVSDVRGSNGALFLRIRYPSICL